MHIGIVNFRKTNEMPEQLIKALIHLQGENDKHVITMISYEDVKEDVKFIKESGITHWIFSGSEKDPRKSDAPQVLMKKLMKLNNNKFKFLMICYSMESALMQSPFSFKLIKCNKSHKKGNKQVATIQEHNNSNNNKNKTNNKTLEAWRNHEFHFDVEQVEGKLVKNFKIIHVLDDMLMTAQYKNFTFTQWHPEHSNDGMEFLDNWLHK